MNFEKPLGPFAVLYEQRKPEPETKKQRSGWQRVLAKRAKENAAKKTNTEKVLRKNSYSDVARSTVGSSDKAMKIRMVAI